MNKKQRPSTPIRNLPGNLFLIFVPPAFIGANSFGPQNVWATATKPGARRYNANELKQDLSDARKRADVVFTEFQAEETYEYVPYTGNRTLFRGALDWGADVVTGAQAHQPGFTVVSIGDQVADLVVTIPHLPVEAKAHQLARHIRLEPGGTGNFLIAGRRLGMHMLALDTIGDDVFGAAVVEILSREGVDMAPVMRQPGTSSTTVTCWWMKL